MPALEASTTDAALKAFGVAPGSGLSTPEQDAQNRATMTGLRQQLRAEAEANGEALFDPLPAADRAPESEPELEAE